MSDLTENGRRLLNILLELLPTAVPNDPRTFISYSDIHRELGLEMKGGDVGESLKRQGLDSLAKWTKENGFPAITGLIVNKSNLGPGAGYYKLFDRNNDDFDWWIGEIAKSKLFDWINLNQLESKTETSLGTSKRVARTEPSLSREASKETPVAMDTVEPPAGVFVSVYRILRDTKLARELKCIHNQECQICGEFIVLPSGERYAEAHHIIPLGSPHNGPDIIDNLLCLCPNHHVKLDYGVIKIEMSQIKLNDRHKIAAGSVEYHNTRIWNAGKKAG